MVKKTRCIKFGAEAVMADFRPAEFYHNRREWRKWKATGSVEPSPFGNWDFGDGLTQHIMKIREYFDRRELKKLSWSCSVDYLTLGTFTLCAEYDGHCRQKALIVKVIG